MAGVMTKRLTHHKVASEWQVSPRTVRNWIQIGLAGGIKLKATKLGAKWMIHPADLDEFGRRLAEAKGATS